MLRDGMKAIICLSQAGYKTGQCLQKILRKQLQNLIDPLIDIPHCDMTVTSINSYDQFVEIVQSGKPVVVDFWATWCGPCRFISPVFEKLSENEEYAQDVGFYKVDVDDQERIAQEVGIRAMPTFVLFEGGKAAKRVVGANASGLEDLVRQSASSTTARL